MKKYLPLLFCVTMFFPGNFANAANGKQTTPIAERSVAPSTLTSEALRAIFTLNISRWEDGQKITIVILSESNPTQRKFLWEYFGLTPARYTEIIDSRVFSGKAVPPIVLSSELEVISKVTSTRGSIGFVGPTVYIGDRNGGFKVLRIE